MLSKMSSKGLINNETRFFTWTSSKRDAVCITKFVGIAWTKLVVLWTTPQQQQQHQQRQKGPSSSYFARFSWWKFTCSVKTNLQNFHHHDSCNELQGLIFFLGERFGFFFKQKLCVMRSSLTPGMRLLKLRWLEEEHTNSLCSKIISRAKWLPYWKKARICLQTAADIMRLKRALKHLNLDLIGSYHGKVRQILMTSNLLFFCRLTKLK